MSENIEVKNNEDKPIKILHVITAMDSGGAAKVILNWYKNIDRTKVQFDFLVRSDENVLRDEIESLGGHIFVTSTFPRHILKNYKETKEFFKTHIGEYKAIHVHGNALIYTCVFNLAKKYGIKTRIMHSHNTQTRKKVYKILHDFNKLRIKRLATDYFACSTEAGKWMFNTGFTVFNNGIDVNNFKFDKKNRESIRKELNLEDKFVIGHVGRFLYSKNHDFLLHVFEKISKIKDDAVLLLFGAGENENIIREGVKSLNLQDKVIFMGVKKDINRYYSCMDLFLFPSHFEGLSLVLVEAQANSLYCIASNTISQEANVSNNIEFLGIERTDIDKWVNDSLEKYKVERNIEEIDSSYKIEDVTMNLQQFYLSK